MKLRLPEELKEKIGQAAKDSGRSMNAEIVYRLSDSFAQDQMYLDPSKDLEIDNSEATDQEILNVLIQSNRLTSATLESLADRVGEKGLSDIDADTEELKDIPLFSVSKPPAPRNEELDELFEKHSDGIVEKLLKALKK